MNASSPASAFLGVSASADPFELLGLPKQFADDVTVLEALGRRMAQVAQHARSQTPEANEVRLALHAAAAQLLDAQVQRLLLGVDADRPASAQPPRSRAVTAAQRSGSLAHDALLVVAANGGWNSQALRRLAMLAHARGIPSVEIPAAVTGLLGAGHAAPGVVGGPASPAASAEETEGISPKPRRGLLAPTLFAAVTVVVFVSAWLRLTDFRSGPAPAGIVPTDPSSAATRDPPPQAAAPPVSPPEGVPIRSLEAADAARAIAAAAGNKGPITPAVLQEMIRAHRSIATGWTRLGEDEIAAVHDAILELLYRSRAQPETAESIVDAIGDAYQPDGSDRASIASTAWSTGTLSRLSMEQNLPSVVDAAVLARLAGALGEDAGSGGRGFAAGASVSLADAAGRLADQGLGQSAWAGWLDVLSAVAEPGSAAHERAVLSALGRVLIAGPEPNASRGAFEAIEILAGRVEPEVKGQTARAVVDWFADDRVSAADLAAVMRTLVRRSSVAGLDESLIPSSDATTPQRTAIREKLELVLLEKDADRSWAGEEWIKLADAQLARSRSGSVLERAADALALSRLCSAARAIMWGDQESAEHVLANLRSDIDAVLAGVEARDADALGGDAGIGWATRYLNARQNIPVRESLLGELTRTKPALGPVAAELVATEAFLGRPASVRRQAQEAVRLYADSPSMVNAVLELLPRAPRVQAVSDVVEVVAAARLPAVSDDAWPLRARRATVERLLQLLAGYGSGEALDELVGMYASSYDARLTGRFVGSSPGDAGALADNARRLAERWFDRASAEISTIALRTRLDESRRRLVGRLSLARGSLEEFAAYQVSAVEAAALTVIAEQPSTQGAIDRLLEELADSRRSAGDVIDQVRACEAAAVGVWRIRLGGGSP